MLAILDASDADFNKLINNLDGAGGSAEDMANTMQNNLSGDITKLMSALQELAISIGTLLMPTIREIVEHIQGFVNKLNSMDDGTKKMIITIAGIVAAIGPLLIVIGNVIEIVGTIMTLAPLLSAALGTLGAAFTAVSWPVLAVVAAIAAVIAIGYLVIKNWDTIKEVAGTVW